MKREIKFRAWHKEDMEMIYGRRSTSIPLFTPNFMFRSNEIELMQYTGLKDKNGKEIYEDDILNGLMFNGSYCLGKVVFYHGSFLCEATTGEKWVTEINPETAEIIGNIHENQVR